jgi:hypothetical protein
MKKSLIIFNLLFSITILNAQDKLNQISAPTSPAAYIIGIQPSSVLSPKTNQALETALYSNFLNSSGGAVIPNDFALEFTPYWATNHGLSLTDYLYPRDILNDQIIRNSSFSIASTQKYLLQDSTSTSSLAFGYRTTLHFGNENDRKIIDDFISKSMENHKISASIAAEAGGLIINKKVKSAVEFLNTIKIKVVSVIQDYCSKKGLKDTDAQIIIDKIFEKAKTLPKFEANPDTFLIFFNNIIDETIASKTTFDKFKNYIRERQGLSLDIAFATLLNYPTNNLNFSILPRWSVWITPAYRFGDNLSFLKLMGVLRLEWYNTDYYKMYFPKSKYYQNNTDYGLAVSTEFDNFSIQLEAVGRKSNSEISAGVDLNGNQLYTKNQKSDFQYIATFSYHVNDQIALTYSLGNNFQPELNPTNTLLSLLSINFGFGAPTEKELK